MRSYFRHFRLFDNQGNILPRGGVTLHVQQTPFEDGGFDLLITSAVCSHKDHYNKRLGRRVVIGRASYPTVVKCLEGNTDINVILRRAANSAIKKVQFKGTFAKLDMVQRHTNETLLRSRS